MQSDIYSQEGDDFWNIPQKSGALHSEIELPGSKSLTNRELVLSALADSPSELVAPLDSRDSQLMIQALTELGAKINSVETKGNLVIVPVTTDIEVNTEIDCGIAGTVMRFVPPVAGLLTGQIRFDGDPAARQRPMQTTIDSLRQLGVEGSNQDGRLPFTVTASGSIKGGYLEIDASASSQFVSGLLLAAPRFQQGLTLKHIGETLPSIPHIEMTIDCLNNRGVSAKQLEPGLWKVKPGPISGKTVLIEPDLSNAGPFMAAALVTGETIQISSWPKQTTQVGKQYISLLSQMGAQIKLDEDLVISGTGDIDGIDADMSECGELVPTIVALAALAKSPSRITGISHIRGHETDRITALTTEINKLGGNVTELSDGLQIIPAPLHGGIWEAYGDHRIVTTAAILGLAIEGITVKGVSAVNKTMPEFVNLWSRMLGLSN